MIDRRREDPAGWKRARPYDDVGHGKSVVGKGAIRCRRIILKVVI